MFGFYHTHESLLLALGLTCLCPLVLFLFLDGGPELASIASGLSICASDGTFAVVKVSLSLVVATGSSMAESFSLSELELEVSLEDEEAAGWERNPIFVDIILELSSRSPLTVVVVDDLGEGEEEGAIAAKTDRVILSPGVVIFFAMKAPKLAIILLCLSKYN